jgi:hypothetical protein
MHPFLAHEFARFHQDDVRREVAATRGRAKTPPPERPPEPERANVGELPVQVSPSGVCAC